MSRVNPRMTVRRKRRSTAGASRRSRPLFPVVQAHKVDQLEIVPARGQRVDIR